MRRRTVVTMAVLTGAVLVVTLVTGVLVAHRDRAGSRPPNASPSVAVPASAGARPSATAVASASVTGTAPAVPTVTAAPPKPGPSATSGQPGQPGLPARLRGQDFTAIPTSRPIVALTFDAGANADGLPAILDTLGTERIPATFFLTGDFATRYPGAVRSIVGRGHRLGNHTVTHPYCTSLSAAAIQQEIDLAEARVRAAGGSSTRPLFRFPYGDRDARTIAAVNDAGYVAVRWTVDSLGWQGTGGGGTAQRVVDRAVGAARPGEIVLMHVGSHPTDHSTLDADALPSVISGLRARGYTFVTLDALLA